MWQEYREELYKNGLNELNSYNDVITHLEESILECEVKQALGRMTMNKASGGDGIPAEVLKNIKSDTCFTVSPSISHEVMGPDAMIFVFWMLSF